MMNAQSPSYLFWQRFKKNRRAYFSLIIFGLLFITSLAAEFISNEKPLLIRYQQSWLFPLWNDYSEQQFGGSLASPADYLDPFITAQLNKSNNWAIYPLNYYSDQTINYFAASPNPAPPSRLNFLGTDDQGRDILARLLYGFRLSILFALSLTAIGTVLGIVLGAIQGYFAGRVDLFMQRVLEVWGSMPELYLLIIFAAIFSPSLWLLLILLSLFSWLGLADYVRADFLKNRQLFYVQAARALGLNDGQIIWRHILPNSLTSVISFLPFKMSAAILALTSLDFLGLGMPPGSPSLGELLAQGKNNLDAWWIILPTFIVLSGTLFLLINIGDGLRSASDVRAYS